MQGGFGPYGGQFNGPLFNPGAGGAVAADFLQRLIDDSFTSIWKMDEASGNAVDTQGVVNAVVAAGVTRGVTSIIPNKPLDDAMGFNASTDTVIAAAVATYDNMFSSDCIFLFTMEITSNANDAFILSRLGAGGGITQYRRTSGSDPRRMHMQILYTGADQTIMSTTDAVALNTPELVEFHWFPAAPTTSKVYVGGVDVTDPTKTSAATGSIQNDNAAAIDLFSGSGTTFNGTGQYAAIKLGTGDAAGALARFNDWNTPG